MSSSPLDERVSEWRRRRPPRRRAGDDSLALGAGSNQARGDAGDDTIGALRADLLLERQRIACGPGRDQVDDMFRNDFAEDDCETIVIAEFHELQALLPPASWERPRLATYSTTPADCEAPSCRLSLDARIARSPNPRLPQLKGLLLGRTTTTIPYRGLTDSPCISQTEAAAYCGATEP
jgi:hypothetical protein